MTFNELKNSISSSIATNGKRLITAVKLQDVLNNIVNYFNTKSVSVYAQAFSSDEKSQARKNMGAVGVVSEQSGVLEYSGQTLYPFTKADRVNTNSNKTVEEALAEKITVRSLTGEGELDYKGNVYYPRTKSGLVSHKGASLETVVDVLDSRSKETKQKVDTFLADADTSEKALDTLKELQSYIKSDETAASQMMQDIANNRKEIDNNREAILKEATRAKQTETYLETQKADKTGYYEQLSVGVADNLSGRDEATEREFVFSASGGANKSINDGTARITSIQGNSLVWNQLAPNIISMNEVRITEQYNFYQTVNLPLGDVFFISFEAKADSKSNAELAVGLCDNADLFGGDVWVTNVPTQYKNYRGIVTSKNASNHTICIRYANNPDNIHFNVRKVRIANVTKLFNGVNVPTTVEEFYARCPENASHEYNEGTIINNNTTAIKSTGFNAWDEEWELGYIDVTIGGNGKVSSNNSRIASKNYCPCIANCKYYVRALYALNIIWFDANKKVLGYNNTKGLVTSPSNACYFKINTYENYGTTYNHDICINLSHTGYRNGEYKPYETFTRQLPTVEGGLKSAGSVFDEIRYNQTTRKWEYIKRVGVVDLGTLSWDVHGTGNSDKKRYISSSLSDAPLVTKNLFTSKYRYTSTYGDNNTGIEIGNTRNVHLYDENYRDGNLEAFLSSINGMLLYYELAEPVVTELDTDTIDFNGDYEVWDFGTEEAIQDMPSAPCKALVKYGFNAVDQIRNNEVNIESLLARVAQLEAQLSAMQIANVSVEEV